MELSLQKSEGPVVDLKCHSLNRASVKSRRLITTSYEHFVCGPVACINHAKCQLDQIRMTKTCWLYLHLFVIHVTLKWGQGHWNWYESVISHTHSPPPPPPPHTHIAHTYTLLPPPPTHTHTCTHLIIKTKLKWLWFILINRPISYVQDPRQTHSPEEFHG